MEAFAYVLNGEAFVGGGKTWNGPVLSDIWHDAAVPQMKNVNDKCANASSASGKITNPPPGTTITITQDCNPLTYNAADSSFQYFISGITDAGSHTISIKFSNSIGSSQKDTVYTVTASTVPSFAFGTSLTICAGGSVPILAATSTNGISGTWSPAVVDNRTSGTYTFIPNAGQCTITSSFVVTVNPVITPAVTISTTYTTICQGNSVTFTTTPVSGGSPAWQWKINGNNAGTGSSLTTDQLQNNDKIQVEMTSNLACVNPATVTSNSITMQVNPIVQPAISIAGRTTVTKGDASLITATVVNSGSSPLYQWQDSITTTSWTNITGGTGATVNYTPAATGVKLRCRLTTNEPCASSTTVTSEPQEFTVNVPTAVSNINAYDAGLRLYPNPVNSYFTIDTLSLSGQWKTLQINDLQMKTYIIKNIVGKANITVNVSALPKGLYFAVLRKKSGETTYLKFIRL